jgi:hypothetical protein
VTRNAITQVVASLEGVPVAALNITATGIFVATFDLDRACCAREPSRKVLAPGEGGPRGQMVADFHARALPPPDAPTVWPSHEGRSLTTRAGTMWKRPALTLPPQPRTRSRSVGGG